MNVLPALFPWQWAILGVVPIGIILLYFLKLRREPLEIPSTFLWMRTIEDLHVNSLMQRLRRNLLLFLQLLFVALAAFALLRPGWQSSGSGGRRMILMLDTSASMQATDVGPSRYDEAKKLLLQQIENMDNSDVAMLMAFDDRSHQLSSYTSDRRRLRDALEQAEQSNRTTELLETLTAAAGLANPKRMAFGSTNDVQVADAMPADMFIYTDGGFDAVNDFDLDNLKAKYIPIGTQAAPNMAIIAFSAERNPESPSEVQAFATIANFGNSFSSTTATLTQAGEFLDASSVELDPGETAGISFKLPIDNDDIGLKLALDAGDSLSIDDAAYAGLSPLRSISVLIVTSGNGPLKIAMETEQSAKLGDLEFVDPSYLETDAYKTRAAEGKDDLIIFDRCAPETMPQASTWFIGSVPPSEDWKVGERSSTVFVIDVDRTHPIMRFLELFALKIVEGSTVEGPKGASVLMTGDSGPLLTIGPRGAFRDLVLGFPIATQSEDGDSFYNTDWPVQRSWPVFVYNVMRELGGAVDTAGAPSHKPGTTVTLRAPNSADRVQLERPDGQRETIELGQAGQVEYTNTDSLGLYKLYDGDRLLQMFAINLFDERESQIPTPETIELGHETAQTIEAEESRRSEAWRLILVCALGLLLVEWIAYSRRVWV